METAKLSKASLEDIVFEGRNRAYGAYLLRKLYGKHVTLASIIAISLFILFLSLPIIARLIQGEEEHEEVVRPVTTVVTLDQPPPIDKTAPPPPPPPPDLPPPPPPVRSTIKFTPPVVKEDVKVRETEEMPDQKKLATVDAGTETKKGNDSGPVSLEGIEGGTGPAIVAEVVEEKPYTYVEQMPTFPGGEEEMMKFIGKNTVYPAAAKRSGLEGTVYIQFTVSKTGEISDIKVVKGLGGGTDEEAVRVVKMMPKWKAGKQNGREVPVRFTLPFRFVLK